jgi:hypothetical protein
MQCKAAQWALCTRRPVRVPVLTPSRRLTTPATIVALDAEAAQAAEVRLYVYRLIRLSKTFSVRRFASPANEDSETSLA